MKLHAAIKFESAPASSVILLHVLAGAARGDDGVRNGDQLLPKTARLLANAQGDAELMVTDGDVGEKIVPVARAVLIVRET